MKIRSVGLIRKECEPYVGYFLGASNTRYGMYERIILPRGERGIPSDGELGLFLYLTGKIQSVPMSEIQILNED